MKLKKITFKKPRHVIQIFRKIQRYEKTERLNLKRITWQSKIYSHLDNQKQGYIKDDKLYLSPQLLADSLFQSSHGFILVDNHPESHWYPELDTQCIVVRKTLNVFEISLANMDLYLRYHWYYVGIPKRDNFKLCELKLNQPVEILINGKRDYSACSRRQRSFIEQSHIVEYLGTFKECYELQSIEPVIKKIPQQRKLVDLRKIVK